LRNFEKFSEIGKKRGGVRKKIKKGIKLLALPLTGKKF
jgi:hypothetical protein